MYVYENEEGAIEILYTDYDKRKHKLELISFIEKNPFYLEMKYF